MNTIDFTKLGGLPVTQYTFGFMQTAYAGALAGLAGLCGNKTILSGVVVSGGTVSDGWISLNGELLPFEGGLLAANVDVIETIEQRTYDDGTDKDVYTLRKAKCVAFGGFPFSDLKPASIIPAGVITMWSGAANAIPGGWALCDGTNGTPNLKGRFVVGYDPADGDFDTIGETGGEKRVTLQASELPQHTHNLSQGNSYTGAGGGGIVGRGSDAPNTMQTGTQAGATGNSHNNLPPYYTIAYIIKL